MYGLAFCSTLLQNAGNDMSMDPWLTIQLEIKFDDRYLEHNSEEMSDFIEETKQTIMKAMKVEKEAIRIMMLKQEHPLWFEDLDDFDDEKVEA